MVWMQETMCIKWLKADGQCSKNLCSTFKKQSIQTQITSLKNEAGNVVSTWDEIAEVAQVHFTKLLGSTTQVLEEALQEVLAAQHQHIFEEAHEAPCQALEQDITLDSKSYIKMRYKLPPTKFRAETKFWSSSTSPCENMLAPSSWRFCMMVWQSMSCIHKSRKG